MLWIPSDCKYLLDDSPLEIRQTLRWCVCACVRLCMCAFVCLCVCAFVRLRKNGINSDQKDSKYSGFLKLFQSSDVDFVTQWSIYSGPRLMGSYPGHRKVMQF